MSTRASTDEPAGTAVRGSTLAPPASALAEFGERLVRAAPGDGRDRPRSAIASGDDGAPPLGGDADGAVYLADVDHPDR